jgi:hypothetical protein
MLFRKKFNALQASAGVTFDCFWSFDNSVFFDFSFLPDGVFKICHIVDYSQNFQFSKAASTSNVCFGVSKNIVNRLAEYNANSYLIPHGMSVERQVDQEVILPGVNNRKAVYAGNLDSQYLKKPLLEKLVAKYSNVDFIFLGSGGSQVQRFANAYFPGRVEHQFLMNYLTKADVLLLLYDVDRFPHQLTNAHKILEYLSAGVVTVSTSIEDYKQRGDLLEMAISDDDFDKRFSDVISNLAFYNSDEKKKIRRQFAAANTYSTRLKEIDDIVMTLSPPGV